ncbi:hypothetical protein J437_LFUL019571 [Ladona fulva]|uniref:UDENN FLCN/SMCR8-type domain-containing protein n=1 Tax=Ladona fulva TaxID=123851 RepID=A0A8K0KUJ0_LADFU|nr:hypothetical protein J437_LFUL019571 [Ladona fulva]
MRWHKGILVPAHIEKYKVIGLCVPERLTVHDMISPRDKNYVTILDVNTKKIFGPAYSGVLLSNIAENFHDHFPSDESLILMLQSVFMQIKEKVYLCNSVITERSESHNSVGILLSSINIRSCDAEIIKYLRRLALRSCV